MGLLDNIKENVPHLKKIARSLLNLAPPKATGPKVSEMQGMVELFASQENEPLFNKVKAAQNPQEVLFPFFPAVGKEKTDIETGFGSTMTLAEFKDAKKKGNFKGAPIEKINNKWFLRGGDALSLLKRDIDEHELRANSKIGSKDFIPLAPEARALATRLEFTGVLDGGKAFNKLKKAIVASGKVPNTSAEITLGGKKTTIGEALLDESMPASGKMTRESKARLEIIRPFVRRSFGFGGNISNLLK